MMQLTYFLDIAESGNMTYSAQRLRVAQPSLSRSLSRLEAELGVSLFVRGPKGMRLSPEGRLFAEKVSPLVADFKEAANMFRDEVEENTEVRVSVSAASEIAIKGIASWMNQEESGKVVLTQNAEGLPRESDILISSFRFLGSVEWAWFSERIMLATSTPEAYCGSEASLARLQECRFVSLPENYSFRAVVDSMCRSSGFVPNTVLESSNPYVVREMISLGLGVGFWPEFSWGDVSDGLSLVPLEGDPRRSICISLTADGANSDLARDCFGYLCKFFTAALRV